MPALIIEQLAVLGDNFVYLLHDSHSGDTAVVDPAVSDPAGATVVTDDPAVVTEEVPRPVVIVSADESLAIVSKRRTARQCGKQY